MLCVSLFIFGLLAAAVRGQEEEAVAAIHFPQICPGEDAEWCTSSNSTGRECNYRRPSGSIVFKLFENIWFNCPKHCFDCKFPGDELGVTFGDLQQTAQTFDLEAPTAHPSTLLVEYWLEHRTIAENSQGPCEDAASFGESGEADVCATWKKEVDNFCDIPAELNQLDPTNVNQDFSSIKKNGFWWCRSTCELCQPQA